MTSSSANSRLAAASGSSLMLALGDRPGAPILVRPERSAGCTSGSSIPCRGRRYMGMPALSLAMTRTFDANQTRSSRAKRGSANKKAAAEISGGGFLQLTIVKEGTRFARISMRALAAHGLAPAQGRQHTNSDARPWQAWRRPTLPRLKTQYHRRWSFSRPSSGWDRVFTLRQNHQASKGQVSGTEISDQ